MSKIVSVTQSNYRTSDRVIRGRDWSWGPQDHDKNGVSVPGTIVSDPGKSTVHVKWDNGITNTYYTQEDGTQDLYFTTEIGGPVTRAFGYDVSKYRPNHGGFLFGCGEVKVTKEEISAWLKMENIIEHYDLKDKSAEVKSTMYRLLRQD